MNIFKRPFLICLLSFISGSIYAQYKPYPDSIKVEFPELRSIVIFQLREYKSDAAVITSFPSTLKLLCENISKSILPAQQTTPQHVEVKHSQDGKYEGFIGMERFVPVSNSDKFDIVITEQQPKTSLTAKGNSTTELLPPGWDLKIQARLYRITVYSPDFTSLQALSKQDMTPVIESINKETADVHMGRKGIQSRLVYNNNAVTYSSVEEASVQDMLGLHAGAGLGFVKNEFYPEIDLSTALYFSNRHNVLRQRVELSYELKFFPGSTAEGKYEMLTNSFLSLSYSRNFSKERPRWSGLGVGYLINSNGDVFQGKTLKIFLDSDIGNSKLNIVPEFYLTNDFKDFNFGLKLRYKF